MITLYKIIPEQWENQKVDLELRQLILSHPVLKYLWESVLESPFTQEVNWIVNTFEERHITQTFELKNEDMTKLYKDIYFYTQIQVNMVEAINKYERIVKKYKLIEESFLSNIKEQLEKFYNSKITTLTREREKELTEYDNSFKEKKNLSSSEMKFISMKLSNIQSKYEVSISQYTWNRLNYLISSKIKSNKLILEIKRKKDILESILNYFELRYKNCQEQIMSWKKVVDNLSFLIKYN